MLLDCPCDQSNGPVTQPSCRGQHNRINLFALEAPGHGWRGVGQQARHMRSVDMTHKTIVKRRHFTDDALLHELL